MAKIVKDPEKSLDLRDVYDLYNEFIDKYPDVVVEYHDRCDEEESLQKAFYEARKQVDRLITSRSDLIYDMDVPQMLEQIAPLLEKLKAAARAYIEYREEKWEWDKNNHNKLWYQYLADNYNPLDWVNMKDYVPWENKPRNRSDMDGEKSS